MKNSSKVIAPVAQKAKQKPVLGIRETKNLLSEGVLNQPVRGPKKTYPDGPPAHSAHGEKRRKEYHAKLFTGRQSAAQVTNQLNPDRTLRSRRSYPGLPN